MQQDCSCVLVPAKNLLSHWVQSIGLNLTMRGLTYGLLLSLSLLVKRNGSSFAELDVAIIVNSGKAISKLRDCQYIVVDQRIRILL